MGLQFWIPVIIRVFGISVITNGALVEKSPANPNTPTLHHVISHCDRSDMIKYFIETGVDVNIQDKNSETPLHLAIRARCDVPLIEYLVELGADIEVKNKNGHTPHSLTPDGSSIDKYLVSAAIEASLNSSKEIANPQDTQTLALLEAVELGNLEAIRNRVAAGDNVTAWNTNGEGGVHLAAMFFDDLEIVRYLIEEAGVDVNSPTSYGATPLHLAVMWSNQNVMEYLVEKGAKMNATDNDGATPFHLAVRRRVLESMQFLLENGADINALDIFGNSPMHDAARRYNLSTVAFLVEHGASLDLKNKAGFTPFHISTELNELGYNIDVVKYLAEKGVDLKTQAKDGSTPLHTAAGEHHRLRTIQFLVQNGADLNARDEDGNTPLHRIAAIGNQDGIDIQGIQFLLDNGADFNARNKNGSIPLDLSDIGSEAFNILLHS